MKENTTQKENEVIRFNSGNYNLICEWWKGHGWPIIPFEFLPKIGYIVRNTCVGFLYRMDDSKLYYMEWIVSNPCAKPREVRDSIIILINLMIVIAQQLGAGAIFTSAKNRGLIKLYENAGYRKTDSEMIHLLRKI